MSLYNTIRFIEAKESGKPSTGRINPLPQMSTPSSINAVSSTYRQMERKHLAGQNRPHQRKYSYCGRDGHGIQKQDRVNHCLTYGHIWTNCNIQHHFDNVCRKPKEKMQGNSAIAVFEALCSIKHLDIHIYNSVLESWVKRPSATQQIVQIEIQALPSSYIYIYIYIYICVCVCVCVLYISQICNYTHRKTTSQSKWNQVNKKERYMVYHYDVNRGVDTRLNGAPVSNQTRIYIILDGKIHSDVSTNAAYIHPEIIYSW